jgi:hypothetical protein
VPYSGTCTRERGEFPRSGEGYDELLLVIPAKAGMTKVRFRGASRQRHQGCIGLSHTGERVNI